jgi:hypothetical protein
MASAVDHRHVAEEALRAVQPAEEPPAAWERLEAGRYRPRRTRGSFPGRELG